MDIESDDSERWEDFFGSSTDLTPSLLGIYDKLTDSLVESSPKKQQSLPDLSEDSIEELTTQNLNIKEDLVNLKTKNSEEFRIQDSREQTFERNGKLNRSKICLNSHNIQRLLQHTEQRDNIRTQKVNSELSKQPNGKLFKRNQSKQLVIPLSKTTFKISQSSQDLVKAFSSSTEYLDDVNDGIRNYYASVTPKPFDSEKTPTNSTNEAFNFEIAMPKKSNAVTPPSLLDIDGDIIDVDKFMELEAFNDRNINPKMTDVIETYNIPVGTTLTENKIPSLDNSSNSAEVSPIATRKLSPPLQTYSRVFANKCSTPISSPLSKTNEESKTSMESLTDRLCEMKTNFSPKESRKMKLLPHRPLSSSSISSTSSSSSSGSEHIKPATSYLASQESLADNSEIEIDNRHAHGTYTVFEKTCMELVNTEANYVEDLRQVIIGYLHDWREREIIPPDQLSILFCNIESIYEFNVTLLKQLTNSELNPTKVARCFIDLKDRFDVYTTYCTNYQETMSLLTTLIQDNHINAILNSTQKELRHSLPLGSYLLKPVQRILKYHLLLDKLCQNSDNKEIAEAHKIMQNVGAHINEIKRKLEQQSRVKELSGILDGWMGPKLTVLGDLWQEGILMEENKPRRVFLFSKMLIITKPKEDGRLQFKKLVQQKDLMINEHLRDEPTSFYVIPDYNNRRSQIKLTAKNRDQKRVWTQDIKSVMLERFDNIPNRARELVYKLGEEEDRTPDTTKWKWPSKPSYLERRSEFRRSEIRNRSKNKRKTCVTTSTSFEGFNNKQSEQTEHRVLMKNISMDDNMVATLPRNVTSTTTTEECCSNAPDCECPSRKSSTINPALSKFNKERSKSVPRMSVFSTELDDNQMATKEDLDSRAVKASKSVEVKMYTTKSIPKRIATLKKNKLKKETSTFYMGLDDEFKETVLRITESTENVNEIDSAESRVEVVNGDKHEEQNAEQEEEVPTEISRKEDAEIVLDLVTKKIDFDRVHKKPQKKKSLENGIVPNSPEPLLSPKELPPRPPSKSPPPLELEEPTNPSEPIYETLLRNVHVPYKFSPILNRSKSQQYYKPREKKSSPTNRPESDYVTLVYSASGNLQKIGDDLVGGFASGPQLRSSDSKINYESTPTKETCKSAPSSPEISTEVIYSRPVTKNSLVKRLLSSSKAENVSGSESSLIPRVRKSIESASQSFGKTNKPPERRVSDVTDMCRQSYIHRQGSEAVGERIANVDYADPRTLFAYCSVNNSAASLNIKGDSVFSLTSSSDSVFDFCKKKRDKSINLEYLDNMAATRFDKDFRDSAIYSDDNEKRHDYGDNQTNGHSDSPPPLPPPRKPYGISNPAVILGPTFMSQSASRSWVMKQIENFSRENQQ